MSEVLLYLDPQPGTFVIDGTLDGGGHAEEILQRLKPQGTFLGVDLDPGMTERFARRTAQSGVHVARGNYADLPRILEETGLPKADGLLVDLGFSSEQLGSSGRAPHRAGRFAVLNARIHARRSTNLSIPKRNQALLGQRTGVPAPDLVTGQALARASTRRAQ